MDPIDYKIQSANNIGSTHTSLSHIPEDLLGGSIIILIRFSIKYNGKR